jgi:FAD:protein FMN transferase
LKTSTNLMRPDANLERQTLNGATMGTRYSAVFYAPKTLDLTGLTDDLFAAVDRIDRQMSTWKPASDLNRLNACPVGDWVQIPPELLTVLGASLKFEQMTGGAFDAGVGDLVDAWGFGVQSKTPDVDKIRALATTRAPSRMPPRKALVLDEANGRARKSAALSLDLSGIAKGFAVDEMGRVLAAHGIKAWLVGIDGDMRGHGVKPDGSAWAVAHERPDRFARDAMGVIELTDLAVATSGNYRHWREYDGSLVSHTMDPRTNRPLHNQLASVMVLAPTCIAADAWATALMVMGPEAGLQTAKRRVMQVIFVLESGEVISTM